MLTQKKEIEAMIASLQVLNAVPHDEIVSWEPGYPDYHPTVRTFFVQIEPFWLDYDYVKNMEALPLDGLKSYNLAQIKTILTKAMRHERFCDGSWAQSIESGLFVRVEKRLMTLLDTQQ